MEHTKACWQLAMWVGDGEQGSRVAAGAADLPRRCSGWAGQVPTGVGSSWSRLALKQFLNHQEHQASLSHPWGHRGAFHPRPPVGDGVRVALPGGDAEHEVLGQRETRSHPTARGAATGQCTPRGAFLDRKV